ncbi:right-handed parallel beta-helix repeat-containing protein [Saccharibacter floricola]|uniref:Right handed beta helix domain-containing protein n=1 Tax=Saccharibacter floricola DSM 15669 TaxID=1123227 RepID=A0ABQ0P1G2_9PROT|nr:hypothetical protein [Saccharibacter floricola]GBQ08892.1 hypothetical protein AA15669_1949 [Saccharibacter floricola DSM 15669]
MTDETKSKNKEYSFSNTVDSSTIASLSENVQSLKEKFANLSSVSLLHLGVINDPNGDFIDQNSKAYQKALNDCAGSYKLIHPANLTVVLHNLKITQSNTYWEMEGNIYLAPNENKNIVDIGNAGETISSISITGRGTFWGNKQYQQGGATAVLGGICSNTLSHMSNTPDNPQSPGLINNLLVSGITIRDTFNWPISLGYITNCLITETTLLKGGNSPQFIWSADNCWFNNNISRGHTDGGFVFYMGCRNCGAINNSVYENNDGIGVYCDTSTQPGNNRIIIDNNNIYNNADSGIGVTTMTQDNTEIIQRNILITNNILSNNNTNGRNGGGSIGIVGAYGVYVHGNSIEKDGSTTTSGHPIYAIYVSDNCQHVTIDANTIENTGSATNPGTAIYLNQPRGAVIRNNIIANTEGASGPTHNGIAGAVGSQSTIGGNIFLSEFTGSALDLSWSTDTVFLSQPDGHGQLLDNLTRTTDLIVSGEYNYNDRYLSHRIGTMTSDASLYLQTARQPSSDNVHGNIVLSQGGMFREFSLAMNGSITTPNGGILLSALSPTGAPLLLQSFSVTAAHGDYVSFPQPFTSDAVTVIVPSFYNGTNMVMGGAFNTTPPNRDGFTLGKFWVGLGGSNIDVAGPITVLAIGELSS